MSRRQPGPSRRLHRLVAIAVVAIALLSGCVSLPTDGPVETGVPVAPPDDGLDLFAPGPAVDAPPDQIVRGFLLASGTGLGDDFSSAREFLTTAGSANWNASGGVTVYANQDALTVTAGQEQGDPSRITVTVSASVTATVDAAGSYTATPPGTVQEFTFQLVKIVDDQWRISQLDAGVLMSVVTFGNQYTETSVYFLSSDEPKRLVPDQRFVPLAAAPRAVVRSLLAGPTKWLSPGVTTAFPDGTALGIEGVKVNDQVATVSLSTEFLSAGATLRGLALVQLEATLGQLQQIARVEISVDGVAVTADRTLADVAGTPVPSRTPTVVTDDGLAVVRGESLTLVDGAVPLPDGVGQIALPYGDGPALGLLDSSVLVTIATSSTEQVRLLDPGGRLLAPSYDVDGWAWTGPTGPGTNTGTLTAIDPISGDHVDVATPGLNGLDLVGLRVSREGARLAYAVRTADAVTVYVAAIVRDESGTPQSVGSGYQIGSAFTAVRDIVWVDGTHIGVLASAESTFTVVVIGVGGGSQSLPSIEDASRIAGGDGARELFVVTSGGDLYGRSGNGWRKIIPDVSNPTFPG